MSILLTGCWRVWRYRLATLMLGQLGLEDASYAINASDMLYELDLSNLILPQNARADDFQMVDAEKIDRNTLLRWLRAYEIEALGAEDTPSLDSKIASRLVQALDARTMWPDRRWQSGVAFGL